jgi:hypothetical protein
MGLARFKCITNTKSILGWLHYYILPTYTCMTGAFFHSLNHLTESRNTLPHIIFVLNFILQSTGERYRRGGIGSGMSSRALRRLRKEKEAARTAALLSSADEEVDGGDDGNNDGGGRGKERNGTDEEGEDDGNKGDYNVGGHGRFMSMLMDKESSLCSEEEENKSVGGGDDGEG